MPDFRTMKVNKRRVPLRHDARTLHLGKYLLRSTLTAPLPPLPPAFDWSEKLTTLQMWDNDTIGDCTCAAFANALAVWHSQTGQPFSVTTADVVAMYQVISGYMPGDADTDTGCDPLDVLNYLRKVGLAGNKIGAFLAVNPALPQELRAAEYLGMGLYTSVELPVTAQNQQAWDVTDPTLSGDAAPGSWGGHEIWTPSRDTIGNEIALTWAEKMPMTAAFAQAYCDLRYVLISPEQLNGQGQTPLGLDLAQLQADLQQVTA